MYLSDMLFSTRGKLTLLHAYERLSAGDPSMDVQFDWAGDEDAFMVIEADTKYGGLICVIFNHDTADYPYTSASWANWRGAFPCGSGPDSHGRVANHGAAGSTYGIMSMSSGAYKVGEFHTLHVASYDLDSLCQRFCPIWRKTEEVTHVQLEVSAGATGWVNIYSQRALG